MVSFVKVLAVQDEGFGYITYIFQNLETNSIYEKYIMCTQFPNWEHRLLKVGDIGYAHYEERIAGVDKYYDGKDFQPYRFTNVQFMKFVDKQERQDTKTITL